MLLDIWNILSHVYNIFIVLGHKETCLQNVGCFKNGYPWSSLKRPVLPPQQVEHLLPGFHLHNRQFPEGKIYQIHPNRSFTDFVSESDKTTYVIIHGWTDKPNRTWINDLAETLLQKNDGNVLVLDYSTGGGGHYSQAVGNIRAYGRIYAHAFLKAKIQPSKLHLIGHSLGAHLASYIAKEIKYMGFLVGWITGLDPALLFFEGYPKKIRLDSSDAEFVDIHHTDSGIRGILMPIGHADFYYNGGTIQPCESNPLDPFGCGHQIVHQFYISSIKYDCIYGIPSVMKSGAKLAAASIARGSITKYNKTVCTPSTCAQVGINTKYIPLRGIFSVLLEIEPPYCSKKFLTIVRNSNMRRNYCPSLQN